MEPAQHNSHNDYEMAFLTAKQELAALRKEIRATRWTIIAVGVGISIVIVASKFIG